MKTEIKMRMIIKKRNKEFLQKINIEYELIFENEEYSIINVKVNDSTLEDIFTAGELSGLDTGRNLVSNYFNSVK